MADESLPSRASATRLSLYLRCLEAWHRDGRETAASRDLAAALSLGDAQVRKDLAALGHLGRRGVGYPIPRLVAAIRSTLGVDRSWRAVIAGAGNLARALLHYRGFPDRGFDIVALFDVDPAKIGLNIEGRPVLAMVQLPTEVRRLHAELGIIAVPSEAAQVAAEALAAAGIRGLLNFAPALIRLPDPLPIVNVDLTIQLEQLAFQVASS